MATLTPDPSTSQLEEKLRTIQMLLELAVARIENLTELTIRNNWERDLHVLIEEIEDARTCGETSR